MRETALILGAGSSKIFGLPLGSELRDQISKDLNIKFGDFGHDLISGSYELVDALRIVNRDPDGRAGSINQHRAAAVEIADAMPLSSSIDEYIERHREDEKKALCAKLAIAKAIIESERASTIYIDSQRERDRPLAAASHSWLAAFLRDTTSGFNASRVGEAFSQLTVVNFNYDRCFEHFTYNWLQEVYRLNRSEAAEVVNGIYIYHPYGRIAPLDWEDPSEGVSYGASLEVNRLIRMAHRIRTYSEAFEPDSGLFALKNRMTHVECAVFLGFGFHQQNMDLISIEEDFERGSLHCFATKAGISEPRWQVMSKRVANAFCVPGHRDIHDHSMPANCEEFWDEYSDVVLG